MGFPTTSAGTMTMLGLWAKSEKIYKTHFDTLFARNKKL